MPTYKYNNGSNVCYNSECYIVVLKRDLNNSPGYLLRKLIDNTSVDNVLESQCMDCDCTEIINLFWPNLIYTGNNGDASKWIVNNLLKNMNCCENVSFGPNSDNTVYTFSCDDGTWTKNKTE